MQTHTYLTLISYVLLYVMVGSNKCTNQGKQMGRKSSLQSQGANLELA